MKLKISTLFHWLYATLMFLPILMFLPSCLYYGFNEHATNTETTTINYKYESNEVNSVNDVIANNIYEFNFLNTTFDEKFDNESELSVTLLCVNDYSFNNYSLEADFLLGYENSNFTNVIVTFNVSNFDGYITLYFNYDYNYFTDIYIGNLSDETFTFNFIGQVNEIYGLNNYNFITYTDYNVIESVSVNTDDTITDKVNRSFEQIFNLPVFSWSKTTFVSNAFIYIGGLFGLTSSNPIVYLFGYWLSISICWLVFDLMIYVPNLAHRWLDRSAIE